METTFLILILSSLSMVSIAQTKSDEVKNAIMDFASATEKQDDERLEKLLDSNFRVVMNQLFGSTTALVMDRQVYLAKIKAREFGGEPRDVTIEQLDVNGKQASAKVRFAGEKMTFVSYLLFIEDANGDWKLISDLPTVG